MIKIIVAYDKNRGIGLSNDLPWKIPGELKWVFETTTKVLNKNKRNALLMGRNTWESLPADKRPLKDRLNIVVSRTLQLSKDDNTICFSSLDEAIDYVQSSTEIEDCFIFGGAQIYEQALEKGLVSKILATEISNEYEVDTFFPEIPPEYSIESQEEKLFDDFKITRFVYALG